MADNNSNSSNSQQAGMKYFRTRIAGLSVVVGDPLPGEVAPEQVRFTSYEERHQGDKVYVGYLATDNQVAIKALAKDGNVESITEKEYNDSTDVEKGAKLAVV